MGLSFQGVATFDDPLLNHGLVHLDHVVLPSGTYLYASTGGSGGVITYKLRDTGTLQVKDQDYFPQSAWTIVGHGFGVVELDEQPALIVGGDANNDVLLYDLGADGRLSGFQDTGNLPNNTETITDAVSVSLASGSVVYLTDAGRGDVHWQRSDGNGGLQTGGAGRIDLQGAQDLAAVDTNEGTFLLVSDAAAQDIVAFRVNPSNGALTETDRLGASTGLFFNDPSAVETVSAFGTTFAVIAGAGSHSLSVMQIRADGTLLATDHAVDTRETRFGGVQDVAITQSGDHVFVVAAGADDGLSLFRLLPDGRLTHLETLVHTTGLGLMNVSALEAVMVGNTLQIFVTSQATGGVAQFHFALGDLGVTRVDPTTAGNVLAGTAGHDLLVGSGPDTLDGGAGDDVLIAGSADTVLRGGAGRDRFVIPEADATIRIEDFEAGHDSIDMSRFFFLRAPQQLDVASTTNGARITFRDTDILVTSSTGARLDQDDIFGAEFDHPDHLLLPVDVEPDEDDRIIGSPGADILQGTTGSDTILGGGGDDEIAGQSGNDTLRGDDGADTIEGGAGQDVIEGGTGADVIAAGSGDDWIDGGAGNDTITSGVGNDIALGWDGDDLIFLNDGDDIAFAGSGNDRIEGGAGIDLVDGGSGRDTLIGGPGADELWGAGEGDLVVGSDDNDALAGGTGNDTIHGDAGDDALVGDDGRDALDGGAGNDILFGNDGNDTLNGGDGDDRLWSGNGNDQLTGGAGADQFIFALDSGNNVVFDFAPGLDKLHLVDPDLSFEMIALVGSGNDTRIDYGIGEIRLVGIAPDDLLSTDFIFGW